MKPFALITVSTLPEAVRESARPGTTVKAGGVDLVDRMKEGLDRPERVVSIAGVPGLDGITAGPPASIGALATLARIAADEGVRRHYPALAEAADEAATPQIRHMATLGGNLCQRPRCWYYRLAEFDCRKKGGKDCYALEGENRFHAIFDTEEICVCVHPSATGVALLAYGATLHTVSPKGKRDIPIEEFFVGPDPDPTRENRLAPGEIVTSVTIPPRPPGARSVYKKLKEKETFDWPLVEACVALDLSGGSIKRARVVLGHVAQVPWRSREAEAVLVGSAPSPELFRRSAEAAVSKAAPLSQNAYKVRMARVLLERALREAVA
jgi:xanthine dehydrogenase YagS FAD-binding subunit